MITPDEECCILKNAKVPEHLTGLMCLVSGGEAFLLEDHVCYAGAGWAILVGFPLTTPFSEAALLGLPDRVERRFHPERLWLVAPAIPKAIVSRCREREHDRYYTLPVAGFEVPPHVRRVLRRASRALTVERRRHLGEEHREAIAEFLESREVPSRIARLYQSMDAYTARSETAAVLAARDGAGHLSALYVVDLAAAGFATYVVGCHSRKHYVPGASDLLFAEMVALAREQGKAYLHLGLGVNAGVRRFKEKWGGMPSLTYESCECARRPPAILSSLLRAPWV